MYAYVCVFVYAVCMTDYIEFFGNLFLRRQEVSCVVVFFMEWEDLCRCRHLYGHPGRLDLLFYLWQPNAQACAGDKSCHRGLCHGSQNIYTVVVAAAVAAVVVVVAISIVVVIIVPVATG